MQKKQFFTEYQTELFHFPLLVMYLSIWSFELNLKNYLFYDVFPTKMEVLLSNIIDNTA